jgi:hypothetical protein
MSANDIHLRSYQADSEYIPETAINDLLPMTMATPAAIVRNYQASLAVEKTK